MTEIDRLQQKYERAKAMQAHAKSTYGMASWCYQAAVETTLEAYRELCRARGDYGPKQERAASPR